MRSKLASGFPVFSVKLGTEAFAEEKEREKQFSSIPYGVMNPSTDTHAINHKS
jgi:hypothetical protein